MLTEVIHTNIINLCLHENRNAVINSLYNRSLCDNDVFTNLFYSPLP